MKFSLASSIQNQFGFTVSSDKCPLISSLISEWQIGSIYLLQSEHTKNIISEVYNTIVDAYEKNWPVYYIDCANNFFPSAYQ